ncbi:hypothetical protein GEMRC1_004288 [Eukaryota sp. GEM-RC1]
MFTCVIYVCRSALRSENNDALIEAIASANSFHLPLVTIFFLPEHVSARRLSFWLEGAREAIDGMIQRDVHPILYPAHDVNLVLTFYQEKAAEVFLDSCYLPEELAFDSAVFAKFGPRARVISTSTIIPPQRIVNCPTFPVFLPRANALLNTFLSLPEDPTEGLSYVQSKSLPPIPSVEQLDPADHTIIPKFCLDPTIGPAPGFVGGLYAARTRLLAFLDRLEDYPHALSTVDSDNTSRLSAFLAQGHISPQEVVLAAQLHVEKLGEPQQHTAAVGLKKFLENVFGRRELCYNHVYHNQEAYRRLLNLPFDADIIDVGNALLLALPDWARITIESHTGDIRHFETNPSFVEAGKTPDEVWNMTHRLFITTGYLHPTLRTYWARKILEFLPTPEEALGMAWRMNNRFGLDAGTLAFPGLLSAFGLFGSPISSERPIYGFLPSADSCLDEEVRRRTRRSSQVEEGVSGFNAKKFCEETELAIEEAWTTVSTTDCAGIGIGVERRHSDAFGFHVPGEPFSSAAVDTDRIRSLTTLEEP